MSGLIDLERLTEAARPVRAGRVTRISAGHVEATGPMASIGDLCEISVRQRSGESGKSRLYAEVAGVEETRIILVPLDQSVAIEPEARVVATQTKSALGVGDAYAGRLIDGLGDPLDGGPAVVPAMRMAINGRILQPLERGQPREILETGIRAIDGGLSLGVGQRIGVFAASGVGKTTLLAQLLKGVACDICVMCLVGERGKEVEGLWEEIGKESDTKRFACVAATSDLSAALRVRAVHQAIALAEYWRDQGRKVPFLLDSVTRFAMALRDIGLAAGAPPTLRAYTPNVFAALPRLVERCGAARSGGSITAIMTVLSETDDVDDPIVEVMKSLLDGHVVLSRQLAERGHFPAIDMIRSVSRQAEDLMTPDHCRSATALLRHLSIHDESRIMIESGIYKSGTNPDLDRAVRLRPGILKFLQQAKSETSPLEATLASLSAVSEGMPT